MACIDVKYTRIGGDLVAVFTRYCEILATNYAADSERRILRTSDGEYLIINK